MSDPEFKLTIHAQGDIQADRDDGSSLPGKIELDGDRRSVIDLFARWLTIKNKIDDRRDLVVFGTLLYRSLFVDRVARLFENALKSLQADQRLRVLLSFTGERNEWASLPWEFLYYPDTPGQRGFFMAHERNMTLARYIPLDLPRLPLNPDERPLRLLIVVSKPDGLGEVMAEEIIEDIEDLAGKLNMTVEVEDLPTVENFIRKLGDYQPHILHYIGHGQYNSTNEQGEIAFLDADRPKALWIPDRDFSDYFIHQRASPRLVFLHLCEGATNDFRANFAGLAPQLMRARIQAVVGMQYPISNNAAIAFSRVFYEELSNGQPLDHAVQIARWRSIAPYPDRMRTRLLGTPVLYMHSRDGVIQMPTRETVNVSG